MSESPDPLIGTVLAGRYQILARLGGGGMGSIYRGLHTTLERPVAIKVLAPDLARDPKLVERFLREARAAAAVTHDNTVDIEDVDQLPDGGAFFVMELLDGRDLARVLREEGRLAWPRAREITVQITRALAATHAAGIVHRDMKPANVFLIARRGTDEFVKIIDFGVAKVDDGPRLTRAGMILGTAGYMAPEQIMGGEVDGRTDVYAVSCMLFEMLTGRRPFVDDGYMKVLAAHIRQPPPQVHEVALDLDIPGELELLIQRGLAKLPEHRFADMVELERALTAIEAQGSGSGQTFAPGYAPSVELDVGEVAPTQLLEQPGIAEHLLADLAYLYVAFAHGTDGVLTNAEMRTLATKLRGWAPSLGLDRLGELLRRIVGEYGVLSSALETEQMHSSAEQLGVCLGEAERARVLEDLRAIVAADERLVEREQQFITHVGECFERRRDPRLRACAVLYLVVGHAADGVDPQEMQAMAEQLRRWMPDASAGEAEQMLHETLALLEPLSRDSERLALVRRCADRLAATTEQARLREVLGDLWRIAGVDGQIAAAEQRLIMDVVDRFGTAR